MTEKSPHYLKKYLMITFGCLVYAVAFDMFFSPNDIAFGGITGVAQILNHYFPRLTVGAVVFVLNVPLFLAGWKLFGRSMLIASLTAMGLSSVMIDVLPLFFRFPPTEDKLLACVIGGAVLGAGLGILFLQGATTGGTEIVARLLKLRMAWIPVGELLMVSDLVVCVAVALVFRSVNTALYGFVAMYAQTVVMDRILYGLDNAKVAYIISDKPDEISDYILHEMERGVTFLSGQGAYTGNRKKVILCAFKMRQIVPLKKAVSTVDPHAFMIVTSAHEVLGEDFGGYDSQI